MKNLIIFLYFIILVSCQQRTNIDSNSASSQDSLALKGLAKDSTGKKPETTAETLSKDSLPYQIVRFYKTTAKSKNPKDSTSYAYVKAVYPKFASDLKFLNNKVLSIVSAEPWTGNKTYSMEQASASFFKEYLEFKKEYPNIPNGYAWDQKLKVSLQDDNLIVLSGESYVYTGGAHGLQSVLYYNLDLKNQKQLGLNDLLIDNYIHKLTDVAESIFRKDEGLSQTETLENYFFEDKIFKLNDNFAITKEGLLFTYNAYEIKSYAQGNTDLLIPYSKIKTLIKPNSFIAKYMKI